ncbi:hypothetical protein [Vibrio europaeus]|uniref:hypothetical protein n=1 Tax=Vibrio europaeus TaxID=300876 RepID=UPI0039DFA11F
MWIKLMSIKPFRWLVLTLTCPLWLPILITVNYGERLEQLLYGTSDFFHELRKVWRAFVSFVHTIGWFATITILGASIYSLGVAISLEFDLLEKAPQIYLKLANIFQNPFSWAAATSIVGSTVAIGHVWNLELNREKFYEERRERLRNRKTSMKAG